MNTTLTTFFDRIYIINLIERKDRRAEITRQFRQIGITDFGDKVRVFPAIRPASAAPFPSVGARGCFMSHLAILREASSDMATRILVCEDDLNFVKDFNERIGKVLNDLNQYAWSFFYGAYYISNSPPAIDGKAISILPPSEGVRTTHFIAFQGSCIAALPGYLSSMLMREPGDPDGGPMHVDGAYSWYRKDHPDELTAIAAHKLGYQRSSKSDIFPPSWYDGTPIVSRFVALIRAVRARAIAYFR